MDAGPGSPPELGSSLNVRVVDFHPDLDAGFIADRAVAEQGGSERYILSHYDGGKQRHLPGLPLPLDAVEALHQRPSRVVVEQDEHEETEHVRDRVWRVEEAEITLRQRALRQLPEAATAEQRQMAAAAGHRQLGFGEPGSAADEVNQRDVVDRQRGSARPGTRARRAAALSAALRAR